MEVSKAPHRRGAHRRLPLAEKRRIVELTLHVGASIIAITREHDLSHTTLYQWQALYRTGKLNVEPTARTRFDTSSRTFFPVMIAAAGRAPHDNQRTRS